MEDSSPWLGRSLNGYCEGQKTQLDVIFTPRLDYANAGWTKQQCACPLPQQRPVNPIEGTRQAHNATMGDKYRFSISKRHRTSLWTMMMSKQRVQFNAADLLTMSPSKGPKMPLHTLMGLQVHLAYVLAHFARQLLIFCIFLPKQHSWEHFPALFARQDFSGFVENSATYVDPRCQAASLLDVTTWQSFHSWMYIVHECPHMAKYMDVTIWQCFHSPSATARRYLQCQGLLNIEHGEVLTWKICKMGVQDLATYEGEPWMNWQLSKLWLPTAIS